MHFEFSGVTGADPASAKLFAHVHLLLTSVHTSAEPSLFFIFVQLPAALLQSTVMVTAVEAIFPRSGVPDETFYPQQKPILFLLSSILTSLFEK